MIIYWVWKGLRYESLEKKFDAKINIQLIIFWSNDSIRYDEDRDVGNFRFEDWCIGKVRL